MATTPAPRCIQVVASERLEAMRRDYLDADPRADIVELRVDLLKDLDRPAKLDALLETRGKPKLVTVRSRPHGGKARPADRDPLLRRALRAGVEYLDVEYGDQDLPLLHGGGRTRRILSYHDLLGTPADLPALLGRLQGVARGALLKIVTFADAASDNLRVRDLLRAAPARSLISFAMGPKGAPSRILAPSWGSAAFFAPRRGAAPSAPGQIPLEDLFDVYRIDAIGPKTRLLGVLASPVGHSLSPLVHNEALRALGLDWRYLPFEADTVAEFLPVLRELKIKGLSVTLPHKQSIVAHLDRLDEAARGVGAVNTVVRVWDRLEGYNTDVEAALAPLRAALPLAGRSVAVIGAGGAARALVYGLSREGCDVTIFNRTASRARSLAKAFRARHLPWERLRRFRCDVLVNATSVGLAPRGDQSPIPASWIAAPVVYDIIYNPPRTAFLAHAAGRGAQVIDGVGMFVGQAAEQVRLFTGRRPPVAAMRRALLAQLRAERTTLTPSAPLK